MARTERVKSETGIYHVMLRGNDTKDIFLDKYDYNIFLEKLKQSKEKSKCKIFAYCLMTNHVHLLIKEDVEAIGEIVKRIAVSYSQYFNFKYGRSGHLFGDRYKSEPVHEESYFLTVIRYIHQNPLKAKLIENMSAFRWSSYNDYIGKNISLVTDTEFALEIFGNKQKFIEFNNFITNEKCDDIINKKVYNDTELREIILSIVPLDQLPRLNVVVRNQKLKQIKEISGASNKQLSRVLGLGRGILERVT